MNNSRNFSEDSVPRDNSNADGEDTATDDPDIDGEHRDVVDEEQREKRDENDQADALLHDDDLHDPTIEP